MWKLNTAIRTLKNQNKKTFQTFNISKDLLLFSFLDLISNSISTGFMNVVKENTQIGHWDIVMGVF